MTEPALRILQIAHNHPRFHAGGTELAALALHRQALAQGMDSWFLGALDDTQIRPNQGTEMVALSDDGRESALYAANFRRFFLAQQDYFGFQREFRAYLSEIRPTVVHIHHVLNFGLEALYVIRSTLPDAKIILTLHDYYLICANNGQLYKHDSKTRCEGPGLHECLKCFPAMNANDFAMRDLDIRNALSLVDRIVSPSHFLAEKFTAALPWIGDVTIVENGYLGADIAPALRNTLSEEVVFGYFGNVSAVKGLADLLDAADLLAEQGESRFRVHVHGAQLFEDQKLAARMQKSAAALGARLGFFGAYRPEDMGMHMRGVDCLVFPSVWWENAPLVLYEALYHGRQVIAYPHGGGPEILRRYRAGILAERSDPAALAAAMGKVIADRSLVDLPGMQIPRPGDMLDAYLSLYRG
jgi:glycosyltransferase involved in cell wall biosynthesis